MGEIIFLGIYYLFYYRYDYEEVESKGASLMMDHLRKIAADPTNINDILNSYQLKTSDDFCYTDPIDKSVSKNQGVRFIFSDGSRIIFRLSGTGSQGATVRIYVEKYSSKELNLPTQDALSDLILIALSISKLEEFTGRKIPTVIT